MTSETWQPSETIGDELELGWVAMIAEAARLIDPGRSEEVEQTAGTITSSARQLVPGTDQAAITVVRRRSVQTLAATDPVPVELNQVQQDCQRGPCLTVLQTENVVRSPDLAAENRWPEYACRAVSLGVRSILSIRLSVPDHDQAFGALSLYSRAPGAFDATTVAVATAFATHAALALDKSTLGRALENRDLIGQAKGILVERHKISSDSAFRLLAEVSQRCNLPLREVADQLVLTGELPNPGHSGRTGPLPGQRRSR